MGKGKQKKRIKPSWEKTMGKMKNPLIKNSNPDPVFTTKKTGNISTPDKKILPVCTRLEKKRLNKREEIIARLEKTGRAHTISCQPASFSATVFITDCVETGAFRLKFIKKDLRAFQDTDDRLLLPIFSEKVHNGKIFGQFFFSEKNLKGDAKNLIFFFHIF